MAVIQFITELISYYTGLHFSISMIFFNLRSVIQITSAVAALVVEQINSMYHENTAPNLAMMYISFIIL